MDNLIYGYVSHANGQKYPGRGLEIVPKLPGQQDTICNTIKKYDNPFFSFCAYMIFFKDIVLTNYHQLC